MGVRARALSLSVGLGLSLGLSVGLGAGCISEPPVPGDEALGHFVFTAQRVDDGSCRFAELDGGTFNFEGTFSRLQSGEGAWFTVNGISREASWDGQVIESPFTAARGFTGGTSADGGICDNQYIVRENLEVALLSQSQDDLLGNDCPQDPAWLLQPGGPPVDPDAGVTLPASTEEGFDANRACGFLVEDIAPSGECVVAACTLVYRVEGVRKR